MLNFNDSLEIWWRHQKSQVTLITILVFFELSYVAPHSDDAEAFRITPPPFCQVIKCKKTTGGLGFHIMAFLSEVNTYPKDQDICLNVTCLYCWALSYYVLFSCCTKTSLIFELGFHGLTWDKTRLAET